MVATPFSAVRNASGDSIARRNLYRRERFQPDCVKVVLDGVPTEGHTAAMLEPYADTSDRAGVGAHGLLQVPAARLNAVVTDLDADGLAVEFHAAGDAAVRAGLDAIEAARKANGPYGSIHNVGHNSFVAKVDTARARDLGAAFEMSPFFYYPTPIMADIVKAVGPERLRRWMPIRDEIDAGALVALQLDVAPVSPWPAIEGMVTRRRPGGGETLGREPAHHTEGSHRPVHRERRMGDGRPGQGGRDRTWPVRGPGRARPQSLRGPGDRYPQYTGEDDPHQRRDRLCSCALIELASMSRCLGEGARRCSGRGLIEAEARVGRRGTDASLAVPVNSLAKTSKRARSRARKLGTVFVCPARNYCWADAAGTDSGPSPAHATNRGETDETTRPNRAMRRTGVYGSGIAVWRRAGATVRGVGRPGAGGGGRHRPAARAEHPGRADQRHGAEPGADGCAGHPQRRRSGAAHARHHLPAFRRAQWRDVDHLDPRHRLDGRRHRPPAYTSTTRRSRSARSAPAERRSTPSPASSISSASRCCAVRRARCSAPALKAARCASSRRSPTCASSACTAAASSRRHRAVIRATSWAWPSGRRWSKTGSPCD